MKKTYSKTITSTGECMKTDYEIALGEFVPAFRAKAAKLMISKYGISQQKAAEMLKVTQASVSKYVNDHYSKSVKGIETDISDSAADTFIKELISGKEKEAQRNVCKACQGHHKFDCIIMVK